MSYKNLQELNDAIIEFAKAVGIDYSKLNKNINLLKQKVDLTDLNLVSNQLNTIINNFKEVSDTSLENKLIELQNVINTAAAAAAGANGWDDTLVAAGENLNQRQVNDGIESIAQLTTLKNPRNGQRVYVKGYHKPTLFVELNPYKGGGLFVYNATLSRSKHDGGTIIDPTKVFPTDWKNHTQVNDWFLPSNTGTGCWVRQADDVKVEYFGAVGDGVTDDYQAIQTAAIYCAKNSKALLFGDSVYVCNSKVVIDSAVTYFKTVRLIGTYRGTGSAAGYAPNKANSGTTILVNDNDFIEVQIKRWFNENIILDGFAIVNTAATIARSAIKLSKGDFANYPEENRYVSNNMFNNIATYGFERGIVFSGNYTKAMTGTSYLWNYFGPTELNNFYPYNGKHGIVLENATLNRLSVNRSLFFNLSGGAIVTTEKGASSHESVLMCQLNFVHFEDCRGMFRLGMGTAPSDGAKNHITMIDVTREACGMYYGKNGSPYGIVINTDLQIKGRHDIYGYLEQDRVNIGQGSTLHSDVNMLARVLPEGGKSLSPSKINIGSKNYVIASQSTKIISLMVSDADKPFDLVVAVKINSSSKGFKEYRVVGQATSGTLRSIAEIGSIDSNITIIPSSYNSNALELSIENRNSASIEVDVAITQNYTGIQNYFT